MCTKVASDWLEFYYRVLSWNKNDDSLKSFILKYYGYTNFIEPSLHFVFELINHNIAIAINILANYFLFEAVIKNGNVFKWIKAYKAYPLI